MAVRVAAGWLHYSSCVVNTDFLGIAAGSQAESETPGSKSRTWRERSWLLIADRRAGYRSPTTSPPALTYLFVPACRPSSSRCRDTTGTGDGTDEAGKSEERCSLHTRKRGSFCGQQRRPVTCENIPGSPFDPLLARGGWTCVTDCVKWCNFC